MIWFDITKAGKHGHRSGLTRVSECLRAQLAALPEVKLGLVRWHTRRCTWLDVDSGQSVVLGERDWLLTPELFCEQERPGLGVWLEAHGARAAAIFHDAIPLRFPEFTWPQSVARHPDYLRLLTRFGRVFGVSAASVNELTGYWRWMGARTRTQVQPITLGADGHGQARATVAPARERSSSVLMVGILEPRKNQEAVLDATELLVSEGIALDVTFVGRVNPHFGKAIEKRIRQMRRAGRPVVHHVGLGDDGVSELFRRARFLVMPSRAEGCGLPVLEALWAGLPVLATNLPSIGESAREGGCFLVPADDPRALADGMRQLLTDDTLVRRLQEEARTRALPRWAETARALASALEQ